MTQWLADLDRILRGEATSLPALRAGRIDLHVRALILTLVLLGVTYGFFMGWFAVLNRDDGVREFRQVLASMLKVPLLFGLTLLVTFPSLYVFNALVGSRLSIGSLTRLLLAAMGVMLAVLASFGPIIAFFSLTSRSYPFILLLNVVLYSVAGLLGLNFLLQTLHRLSIAIERDRSAVPPPPPLAPTEPSLEGLTAPSDAPAAGGSTPRLGALDPLEGHVLGSQVKNVFRVWIAVFAVVGAQMAWVLRPFVGHPRLPFAWFRPRESNFFEAVWKTLADLFS
jgi:hypothetical protein